MTETSPRLANVTCGAIAVTASLGLAFDLGKSVWTDEAASIYSSHLSWHDLWRQSEVVDRVFLAYYSLLHVWAWAGSSLEWARVLSLCGYALTVYLVGYMGNRLRGFWCGVTASLLCATNPLLVEGALDARPYALTALAATLAIAFLLRWTEEGRTRWLWWFVIATAGALLLQEFAVLAPLSAVTGLIVLRSPAVRKWGRRLVAPLLTISALCILWLAVTENQRRQVSWIRPLLGRNLLVAFDGPVAGDPNLARLLYSLAVLAILVTVALITVRSSTRLIDTLTQNDLENFGLTLAWAALPTLILIVVSFATPLYSNRYVTASAPGLSLALGLLTVEAYNIRPTGNSSRGVLARIAVSVVTVLAVLSAVASSRHTSEDVRQASRYLERHVGRSGVVAYPNRLAEEEFQIYQGSAPHPHVAAWPMGPIPVSFSALNLRLTARTFSLAPRNVWIAFDVDEADAHRFSELLLSHGYSLAGSRTFAGTIPLHVEHFQR